jgi:hypothetical protein
MYVQKAPAKNCSYMGTHKLKLTKKAHQLKHDKLNENCDIYPAFVCWMMMGDGRTIRNSSQHGAAACLSFAPGNIVKL